MRFYPTSSNYNQRNSEMQRVPKPSKNREGIMSKRVWLYGFTMSVFQLAFGHFFGHRTGLVILLAILNATALTFLVTHVYLKGKQEGSNGSATSVVVHDGDDDEDENLKFKG